MGKAVDKVKTLNKNFTEYIYGPSVLFGMSWIIKILLDQSSIISSTHTTVLAHDEAIKMLIKSDAETKLRLHDLERPEFPRPKKKEGRPEQYAIPTKSPSDRRNLRPE